MIDTAYPIDSTPVSKIRHAMHFAQRLSKAARACQINVDWLVEHAYRPITMLDFDIIRAALPSETTRDLFFERKDRYENDNSGPMLIEAYWDDLIGPYTLRFCLQNLEAYTIPYGALAELLAYKKRISGELTQRSQQFLLQLDEAAQSPDPATLLLNKVGRESKIGDLLRDELVLIDNKVDDLETLDRILEHEIPIEDLVGERKESFSRDAFLEFYNHLQFNRPDLSRNNVCDALNVAMLVRIFNAPRHMQYRPILISQTQYVANFRGNQDRWFYINADKELPDFIQDKFYLKVMQSLLTFCVNNYQSVLDEAILLDDDVNKLLDAYRNLLYEMTNKDTSSTIINFKQRLLEQRLRKFQERWLQIFQPINNSLQLDRVHFSNILLKPEVVCQFESGQSEEVRNGIDMVIRHLQSYDTPLFNVGDVLTLQLPNTENHRQNLIEGLFSLSWRENDGTLLAQTEQGRPIDVLPTSNDLDEIRYLLHPASTTVGAVLAFDIWKDEAVLGGTQLSIVWRHRWNATGIWREGTRLLRACLTKDKLQDSDCSFKIFTEDGEIEGKTKLINTDSIADKILLEAPNIQYFELRADNFTFFADILPLEATEMQAGIVLPRDMWRARIRRAIATVVAHTSIVSLEESNYRSIFRSFVAKIGLMNQ